MDSHFRSIIKSLSWRVIAFVTTTAIAWKVTGTMEFGLTIGFFDFIVKFLLYYFHERGWEKIKLGRPRGGFTQGEGI